MIEYRLHKIALYPRKQDGQWVCEYIIEEALGSGTNGQRGATSGTFGSLKEAEDYAIHEAKSWIDQHLA
jgi:hypothetical protein